MNNALPRLVAAFLLLGLAPAPGSAADIAHPADTMVQYLSGHGKDDAVPWRFMCTSGAHSGYWTNLSVPSQWDMHGFGTLSYHKDPTNAWDEKGLYEHEFEVPQSWTGRRVFLVFDGAMTDTSAKLNGQSVGPMHQGGFYRFQYEVTDLVKFGATNRLEVTVAKHSANTSVNNAERLADYWVFGGIYRPVYIEAVPQEFIKRVAIDARANGDFSMNVFIDGAANADSVEGQIMTLDGKNVGDPFSTKLPPEPGPTNSVPLETRLQTRINSPELWTAETPDLYLVEVSLKRGSLVLHRYRQRFGFRTMEVRDGDGLYVNGKRVILKGADRHSFWPDSGRCLSEAVHRLDIETMKDMNMNAVRMSHYPPDAEFLDLCDELGLYVLDELAGWHHHYDTAIGSKLVKEMVTRDVNHPCILFWDNGNEGGFNTNLDHLFSEYDPQHRRVLHPWAPFSGVNTAHYLAYDTAKVACEGKAMFYHNGRESEDTSDTNRYIYMPTEFQHGLFDGGAGAGLEDYWKLMTASKFLGGGFIWALTDDGVKRPDTGEIDTAGNQAPDGIVGPYRQKEGSFYTIKELWSPITVRERTLPSDFAGELTVENHYSFTDASQCRFLWELRKFHRPGEPSAGYEILAGGKTAAPAIAPGESGALKLSLPDWWQKADALSLRVSDPTGRELWTWVWALPGLQKSLGELAGSARRTGSIEISETGDALQVEAGELKVRFSKQTGLLLGVMNGDQTFSLSNGPRRADGGAAQLMSLNHSMDGSNAVVTATYDGAMKSVLWRVRSDGWVQCDYTYAAAGPKPFIGVAFDYPENLVRSKKWLGDGPYRVWKNRLRGETLNVWEDDYNNTITGWRDWIYPEFKGCFAGVRWMQLNTTEGPITLVPAGNDLFVQVLTPEFPPKNLVGKTEPSLPQAGLAFLNAIPPVGSKFKSPDQTGPQGQPNMADGEYSGSVSFFFGDLPR